MPWIVLCFKFPIQKAPIESFSESRAFTLNSTISSDLRNGGTLEISALSLVIFEWEHNVCKVRVPLCKLFNIATTAAESCLKVADLLKQVRVVQWLDAFSHKCINKFFATFECGANNVKDAGGACDGKQV